MLPYNTNQVTVFLENSSFVTSHLQSVDLLIFFHFEPRWICRSFIHALYGIIRCFCIHSYMNKLGSANTFTIVIFTKSGLFYFSFLVAFQTFVIYAASLLCYIVFCLLQYIHQKLLQYVFNLLGTLSPGLLRRQHIFLRLFSSNHLGKIQTLLSAFSHLAISFQDHKSFAFAERLFILLDVDSMSHLAYVNKYCWVSVYQISDFVLLFSLVLH